MDGGRWDRGWARGLVLSAAMAWPGAAWAEDLYVDATAGGGGDGSELDPFDEIQDALDVAVAGDVIHVRPGTYAPLATVVDGSGAAPITVVGEPAGDAIVQADGTALEAHHEWHTFQGIVFDGSYGAADTIDADGANFLELFDVEVRRSGADCIDLHTIEGVLVANSSIHHCVAEDMGMPAEAHGVTGDSVFDLELRDTEVFLVSGDAVQVSRPRLPWDELLIRRCTLWSGALDEDAGPIAAGTIVGRSAVGTRVGEQLNGAGALPRLEVEDTTAYGFRGFAIGQAAFDLIEDVDALVDRVTVYDSELGFRLRGPALQARIQTAVIYDVDAAVRYEDGLAGASILATTLGADVLEAFRDGGGDPPTDLVVENLLVLGDALPDLATGGMANLAVGPEAFVDVEGHDYHLIMGSDPVDAGVDLDGVSLDRDGTFRPVGTALDIGAYEWAGGAPPPPPPSETDDGGSSEDEGPLDTTTGADGTTGEASTGEPPPPATGGTGTGFDMGGGQVSGCGCRGGSPGGATGWGLLTLMGWRRRRLR